MGVHGSSELMAPIRVAHVAGMPSPTFIPLFRRLARDPRIELDVFYASSAGVKPFDGGFGRQLEWDADLTSGYRCSFLRRADRTPFLGDHLWSVRNWDVAAVLARGKYDVLWTSGYNSLTYLLAAVTQRVIGGQVLFREEQTLLDPRSVINHVVKQIALRAVFSQGRGLYISTENRRWFEHYGVSADRLHPAPYAVDNDSIQAAARELRADRAALRRGFGIPEQGGPVIVTVSRLIPKKQPLFLLEAFRRARERHQCVLLVAGSGPMEDKVRAEVKRQRIPDVVFTGFLNRSQVLKAYAAADVFALLSRERETFGLAVAEAMNFGLPIVVSDRVGCAADLVSTDYNGYVVSSTDPAAAGEAVLALIGDAGLREEMGSASLRRIEGWNLERTAEGIIAAAQAAVA